MSHDAFFSAAIFFLGLHLIFNFWVVFGAAFTKGRPRLELFHIVSLVYGVIMENAPWPCPLTLAEKWCEARAGLAPYSGPFEVHYLKLLVSPVFPLWLLEWGAVAIFLVNAVIYARRYVQQRRHAI